MSPEIMNNQKYNSKTDIWSLGVIITLLPIIYINIILNDQHLLQYYSNYFMIIIILLKKPQ